MSVLHVAQLNFLPAPAAYTPAEILEHWPSLADIAEAAASSGTRVSVIQAAAHTERVTRNGIDYFFIDVTGMDATMPRGGRLARLVEEIDADILHVHGLGFAEDACAVSQCLPRLPILFQDHADRPPRWWQRRQWRRWYACAAGFVFTAPEQARSFATARLFGPLTRVFVIPESSSRFSPGSRARARAETGLYGDPCVLWVGRLNRGKDPLTVLDGVARALPRLRGLQLWCTFGAAPLLDAVQQRIEQDPQLIGRVHLLGRVEHARVETLMRAADLFVSGSLAEGSGYALLEAMACGVAPVVTDIPSFRALTGDGRVGSLWPCGNAAKLAEALIHAAATRPSPQRVRAHFDASLSFAAVGRKWANAYIQILDERLRRVG